MVGQQIHHSVGQLWSTWLASRGTGVIHGEILLLRFPIWLKRRPWMTSPVAGLFLFEHRTISIQDVPRNRQDVLPRSRTSTAVSELCYFALQPQVHRNIHKKNETRPRTSDIQKKLVEIKTNQPMTLIASKAYRPRPNATTGYNYGPRSPRMVRFR